MGTSLDLQSLCTSLHLPTTHVTVGLSNLIASNKDLRSLFVNRRLPLSGWSDIQIQHLLYTLATLDTNHKQTVNLKGKSNRWCGVGEREGRVYSSLVLQRHSGLSHGTGRSGDLTEPQPKAVGSSVLAALTRILLLDLIQRGSGLRVSAGIVLPLCTGMSMALVLASLRDRSKKKEEHLERNIVLWSRIDQKSCYKAIGAAGLKCIVVPTRLEGDCVVTDMEALQELLEQQYKGRVLAVLTTTSCFAPRVPDVVDQVAELCQRQSEEQGEEIFHVINNAYGLQCAQTSKLINRAVTKGRVDAIVCSTDKNFLVPVGGAIVVSPTEDIVKGIGKTYAGRASSSPMVDLFITLLSMGLGGYQQLLQQRQEAVSTFPHRFAAVAEKHGERLLQCTAKNTISFGITLDGLSRPRKEEESEQDYLDTVGKDISSFGAMLFNRCVSGTRVVPRAVIKAMGDHTFHGFGSSVDGYPHAYLTAACAIGVSAEELDLFLQRLDKCFNEFHKKREKKLKEQSSNGTF